MCISACDSLVQCSKPDTHVTSCCLIRCGFPSWKIGLIQFLSSSCEHFLPSFERGNFRPDLDILISQLGLEMAQLVSREINKNL